MESRKKRNLEIEKKKKQKQLMFTMVLTCLIVVVVGALGYAVWDIQNRRTIMTFGGERVATTDFRFFHLMNDMPAGEAAQEAALDALLMTLVVQEAADRHGLSLTSAEMSELTAQAAEMREQFHFQMPGALNFISDRRIAELWSIAEFFEPLMDIYEPYFEIDEEAFAESIEAAIEEWIIDSATETYVKYIASFDWEEIQAAAALTGEGDFDALVREHSRLFDEEGEGVEPIDFFDFLSQYNAWAHWEALSELEPGEVSEVIEVDGWFFIVQIYSREFDEERKQEILEEFAESERESLVEEGRWAAFIERLEGWVADADYSVNERAIRRF